jgi:hypothetical protein
MAARGRATPCGLKTTIPRVVDILNLCSYCVVATRQRLLIWKDTALGILNKLVMLSEAPMRDIFVVPAKTFLFWTVSQKWI